ncbi:MAG: AMMECR1 domain-containing protein, partial [Aquificota bacterium]
MDKEHPLVSLARRTIEEYVKRGVVVDPPPPREMIPEMRKKAGVFVSLKKHGRLRGCIGTFLPT